MKKLYKFHVDYGRQGDLEGLFIAEEKDVKQIIGKNIYFGEVLGKHSDVSETMTEEMFGEINLPTDTLEKLEKELGATWSGINPVQVYADEEEWE